MKRFSLITSGAALAAASILSLGALSVQAQTTTPSSSSTQTSTTRTSKTQSADAAAPATSSTSTTTTTQTSAAVNDAKLNQFADAYVAVQQVQKDVSAKLSSETDTTKTQQVQDDAQIKIVDAIKKNGMQLDEYNQLAQLINSDDELRTRAVERIQQRSNATR